MELLVVVLAALEALAAPKVLSFLAALEDPTVLAASPPAGFAAAGYWAQAGGQAAGHLLISNLLLVRTSAYGTIFMQGAASRMQGVDSDFWEPFTDANAWNVDHKSVEGDSHRSSAHRSKVFSGAGIRRVMGCGGQTPLDSRCLDKGGNNEPSIVLSAHAFTRKQRL